MLTTSQTQKRTIGGWQVVGGSWLAAIAWRQSVGGNLVGDSWLVTIGWWQLVGGSWLVAIGR